MTSYYVDSIDGDDGNAGTSEGAAWETLSKVSSSMGSFAAGDFIYFKRTCTWTGELNVTCSGSVGNEITFSAYGSGSLPTISYPGGSRGFDVYGDYLIFDYLRFYNVDTYGMGIRPGGDHITVQYCQFEDCGTGIKGEGDYLTVTNCDFTDMHIVVSDATPGNDWGAVGIQLRGSYCEVAYCTFDTCKDVSIDYGYDGGALEWAGTETDCSIHHCYAVNCDGFLETFAGDLTNLNVYNNLIVNCTGKFLLSDVDDVETNWDFDHNTIVQTTAESGKKLFNFYTGAPTAAQVVVTNNIFYLNGIFEVYDETCTHTYNMYYLTGGTSLGDSLGTGESLDDPEFVSVGSDHHLNSSSPAIDAGTSLGYADDYDGHARPNGSAPDLGCYEYYSTGTGLLDDPNLVSLWYMEEASGTRADEIGSNDLTDNNTVTQSADAQQGSYSAEFTRANSEYLSIADNASLSITGALTICFWTKLTSTDAAAWVSKYNGSSGNSYMVYLSSGVAVFSVDADGTGYTSATGATTLSTATWYHIVAVYNGADLRIYLNGALDSNGSLNPRTYSAGIYDSSTQFEIGHRVGSANYLNGLMDEVALFNRALTADEIADLYANGFTTATQVPLLAIEKY